MNEKIKMLFSSDEGKEILKSAEQAIIDYNMLDRIKLGVLLGLSGGADSVMLLLLLIELKKKYGSFPILALHVNHMIRGESADSDELFSKQLCDALSVPFSSQKINVPLIAEQCKKGVEEAARDARYALFNEKAEELGTGACIAVAHNSTDNLETIVFNMMRGAGISGLCGIRPVRDNIIRPLIYSSKQDIISALDKCGIKYVTDETNSSFDYSRNYIRHAILPALKKLNESPEKMGLRISRNLFDDKELIDSYVDKFINDNVCDGYIKNDALISAPKSLFYRVISKMMLEKTEKTLERTHVDKIYSLLCGGDFSYSLPGAVSFVSKGGFSCITATANDDKAEKTLFCRLSAGVNHIPGYESVVILSDTPDFECYSNVYKISIQASLPSDIINDGLYLRQKNEGDSYSYGGITRKLKKLFVDKKIPESERMNVPVVCDKDGILWVSGFGVRGEEEKIIRSYIAIAEPKTCGNGKKFYVCSR